MRKERDDNGTNDLKVMDCITQLLTEPSHVDPQIYDNKISAIKHELAKNWVIVYRFSCL